MQVTSKVEVSAKQPELELGLEGIRQRRDMLRAQASREHQSTEEPEVPVSAREDVESVEVTLPDGRVIEFGPPNGVSLTMRVATFPDVPPRATGLLQVLMCIRSVDGTIPRQMNSMIDAQKMANVLGDQAIDILATIYSETWPPVTTADLPTIKKNLRRS